MGTVEVHLLYVSNFFINYLILKMIFVTILLWMKAAQGLYVNKDDNNDDLQSFSILQNFNLTLKDDKVIDLPLMTLMSEPNDKSDDKPMKKRKFKKMILKKRIMRQKAKEQAFANMLADLNMDKMNMAERFKVMETEDETENLDSYEVVEMHSEANAQASPDHDDSVAEYEGKASGSPVMDDDSDAEESDSDSDSDSESDSSDSDSDSDSEESDHELEAADEEESGDNNHDDSDGDSSDSSSDSDSDSSDSDGPDYYNGDEYEYSYQWYPHEEYVYNYEWAYTP